MGVNLTCVSAEPILSLGSRRQGTVQTHRPKAATTGLELAPAAAVREAGGAPSGPVKSNKGCRSRFVTSRPEPFLSSIAASCFSVPTGRVKAFCKVLND